ncbi:MAG: hypothetical protein LBJ59_07385 [Zoogloeaceae bacterium]|jgi:hypothetical protein|nr:hypothetical protein [Zoogloeaceae bacterium]
MILKISAVKRPFFHALSILCEMPRPLLLPLLILLAFLAGSIFGVYLLHWEIEKEIAAGNFICEKVNP